MLPRRRTLLALASTRGLACTMNPKASPPPPAAVPQERERREKKISAVVPKMTEPPKMPSGLRPAVRPPLPPAAVPPLPRPAMPPRPMPARRPEDRFVPSADLVADDTGEITLVESVSAQLVSASRDDAFEHDDPPTRETPIDTQAMLRAVTAEGLPSPIDKRDTPTQPPPPMPSMFTRPDPTPRMNQPLVAPPPPRPITPPQFPAMRSQPSAIPSPPVAFAPLPDLPLALLSPPQSWRPAQGTLPAPSSSSMPIAPPSTPSFVTGIPPGRRPLDRPATGAFPLPHPVARRAYLANVEREPESTWKRKVWLVFVAVAIAATIVGLAHLVTGGSIWSP